MLLATGTEMTQTSSITPEATLEVKTLTLLTYTTSLTVFILGN